MGCGVYKKARREDYEFGFGYMKPHVKFSFWLPVLGVDEGCGGNLVMNLQGRPLFRIFFFWLYHMTSSFQDYATFSIVHICLYSLQPLETVRAPRHSQSALPVHVQVGA